MPKPWVIGLITTGVCVLLWLIAAPLLLKYRLMDRTFLIALAVGNSLGTGVMNAIFAHFKL